MARTGFTSVDEYIASQPEATQGALERVRSIIRRAVPGGDEVISYKIPAYRVRGRIVIYYAAWTQHYSLYLASRRAVAVFKEDLAPYEVSKGTIRLPLTRPVPARLIARIAKFRAEEVAAREKAKGAAPKKRRARATA